MRRHALPLPVLAAVALSLLFALPVEARDASAVRGEAFAREHCARCHALGPRGASPMREAPPFRTLAGRFPVDDLADVLAEGVDRRHPAMPDFRLDPTDAANLAVYLKALRR
ncbi:c-type cytochrome [Methylorubrum thiocyanatum]